jgi:threonine aldolase
MTTPVFQVGWEAPPRLDLRYEVTHRPTPAMWEAMMAVTPGMASAGQDPVVNELESSVASMTGHEAALFLPTTTNGTVLAFMTHDVRGQLAVMEARCHIYWVERLHVSQLGGAAPRLIPGARYGAMGPDEVEAVITEMAYGYQHPTGMVCLENTHNVYGGTTLTPEYTRQIADIAHRHGAHLFLDGARVFNAAVAQGVPVRALTSPADHVVVSLNKGLGAPYGALLCSDAAFIERARVVAKRLGLLAVHKAGLFAAAGLVAIREMMAGLVDDHRRARRLANDLSRIDGLDVDLDSVQTNLVRVSTAQLGVPALDLAGLVARDGLAIHVIEPYAFKLAICWAIDDAQIDEAISILQRVVSELPQRAPATAAAV